MNRFVEAWHALRGADYELNLVRKNEAIQHLRSRVAEYERSYYHQELAKATDAMKELQRQNRYFINLLLDNQIVFDYEGDRRNESDKLAKEILNDMKINPSKYIQEK